MSLLKSTTDENASAGFETTFAVLTDIHARALTTLVQSVTQLWFSHTHSIQLFAFRLFFFCLFSQVKMSSKSWITKLSVCFLLNAFFFRKIRHFASFTYISLWRRILSVHNIFENRSLKASSFDMRTYSKYSQEFLA